MALVSLPPRLYGRHFSIIYDSKLKYTKVLQHDHTKFHVHFVSWFRRRSHRWMDTDITIPQAFLPSWNKNNILKITLVMFNKIQDRICCLSLCKLFVQHCWHSVSTVRGSIVLWHVFNPIGSALLGKQVPSHLFSRFIAVLIRHVLLALKHSKYVRM